MTVIQAIAVVMAVVQFVKKLLPKIIKDGVAFVLTLLVCIGVTAYKYLSEGLVFDFGAITFLIEVIVGAISGYGLLKVAGSKKSG